VAMAKKACPCCTGGRAGIVDSFTDAQMLKRGHAIQLHALRYRIAVYPKKKKAKKAKITDTDETDKPLEEIDFRVDLPEWAASVIGESDLDWLD
jgi:hypothetical protein